MSETISPAAAPAAVQPPAPEPIAQSAPGAVISEPTSGTTPEVAAPPSATPADFPETPAEPTSILSGAEPEAPAAAVEPEAEAPKEAEPEAPPPEPLAPPVYEPFTLPEGVQLTEEKLGAFTGLLGEFENKVITDPTAAHAAAQEFGQKVLDLYVSESQAAAAAYAKQQQENWTALNEQWTSDFRADPQLGGNRVNTSLQRMGALMDLYGQHAGADRLQGVRDAFTLTGAGNHPEVLRFAHWMASRLTETPRIVQPAPRPPNVPRSKAQSLYRNSVGAA
jgi:hypothetical protein